MTNTQRHIPVMLDKVLTYLNPEPQKVYVDATFGFGGYTTAILQKADCKVIAIDRDPSVKDRADELKEKYKSRFDFKQGCFSALKELIDTSVDGIVFDIGVSSMQLDDASRGFSFSKESIILLNSFMLQEPILFICIFWYIFSYLLRLFFLS